MRIKDSLTALLTSSLLTSSTLNWADDTDIFLNSANSSSTIKPNVLFLLDNSGSMGWDISDGSQDRIDVLKESFQRVIDSSTGINVGLQRYWDNNSLSDDSDGLYHPVMDIDLPLTGEVLSAPAINSGTDDVTQTHTGTMDLDSDSLTIGEKNIFKIGPIMRGNQHNVSANQRDNGNAWITDSHLRFGREQHGSYTTGLIFNNLDIPSNANIIDARITLTPWGSYDLLYTPLNLKIRADSQANPPFFGTSSNTPRGRSKTSNEVTWRTDTHPVSNYSKTMTPNLSSIVQEVIDSVNFNTDRIAFIFDNINSNDYDDAHDTDQSKQPTFSLTYSLNQPEDDKVLGLRFEEVDIPQGAIVTNARIRFFSKGGNNNNLKMTIQAEDSINPPTFTSTTSNISTRSLTSPPVTWDSTPWPSYNPGTNTPPEAVYSADIKDILQSITDKQNWCGGNPMAFVIKAATGENGFREAFSSEGDSLYKPTLELDYQYNPSMPGTGCMKRRFSTSIEKSENDAQKDENKTKRNRNSLELSNEAIGLRFNNIPLNQGATILEAFLEFTASDNSSNNETVTIHGEDIDNSPAFTSDSSSITGRTKTSNSTSWVIDSNWQSNRLYRSTDVKDIVQEIVSRSGWSVGNQMSFILNSAGSPTSGRKVYSFNGSQGNAPRLYIRVGNSGYNDSTQIRVRDRVKSYVNSLRPDSGTPTVDRLLTAAKYFQGSNSPIEESCQTNHLVLLSDGDPTGLSTSTRNFINNSVPGSPCSDNDDDLDCGQALSGWMLDTDFKSNVAGDNKLILHTIGFDLGDCTNGVINEDEDSDTCIFLKTLANPKEKANPEGTFSSASNTAELLKAFKNIIESAKSSESSFTSPGVAANQYNNSTHLSQLYYSIFKPSPSDRWQGNIKRYTISTDPAGIFDAKDPSEDAVDPETGFFKDTARSFWGDSSAPADGKSVDKGGAADNLPDSSARKLFTFIGSNPAGQPVALNDSTYKIIRGNSQLTPAAMGLDATNTERRNQLIDWIRDPGTKLGDPLHSVPALATYKCTATFTTSNALSCDEDDQELVLFVGTNDGFLHAINSRTGIEEFSFMPQEMLQNLDKLNTNDTTDRSSGEVRPYGLDGSVTLWTNDKNRNGVLFGGADTLDVDSDDNIYEELSRTDANTDEFVYAYIGMRRGGRNYYAIDATDLSNPKVLWYIKGGEGDFMRLGQTWSKPVKTKIKIGVDSNTDDNIDDSIKDVLIFTGGYDPSEDTANIYQQSGMGNAIYIVDAKTGAIIWSASSPSISDSLHEFDTQDLATWGVQAWNPQQTYVPVVGSDDTDCGPNILRNKPQCVLKGGLVYKASHELTGGGTNPEPGTSSSWELVGRNGDQAVDNRTHNLTLNKMNYSTPGSVRVIDLEGDGLADQMFFADTGGQVWRLFINNCKSSISSECAAPSMNNLTNLVWPSDSNGNGEWDNDEGVVASLGYRSHWGSSQILANARKFFVEPDISAFRMNGKRYIAIAIGSGTRPDPLGRVNNTVVDRFYMMAMPTLYNPSVDSSNVNQKEVPDHTLIHHDNSKLSNVTNTLDVSDVFGSQSANWEKGWFFDLSPGEKVMTESTTYNEIIFFNTYLPSTGYSNSCTPAVGTGRAYSVALRNANPVREIEDDVPTFITEDGKRYGELANTGIPSKTTIILPNGKNGVICVGAECIKGGTIGGTGNQSYWRQIK
ncbi:hypothetical protein [Endozoicomonas numazuensis]|nr:hypothetical protein [Endozoicomonas numazuensis]